MNVDKKLTFLDSYPPPLVNVIFERPLERTRKFVSVISGPLAVTLSASVLNEEDIFSNFDLDPPVF